MTRLSSRTQSGQKWLIPLFCLAFGCLVLLAGWPG